MAAWTNAAALADAAALAGAATAGVGIEELTGMFPAAIIVSVGLTIRITALVGAAQCVPHG